MGNKSEFKTFPFRFIEGAANAACNSTVSGLLVQMFPNKIASVMGQTRMFLSIGYMLGNA